MTSWLWFVATMVGLIVAITPGCAANPSNPACGEDRLAAIVAQCVAVEVERGCDTDPVKLCPELVAQCEARIDRWERCR